MNKRMNTEPKPTRVYWTKLWERSARKFLKTASPQTRERLLELMTLAKTRDDANELQDFYDKIKPKDPTKL
jgi:hypothetical protein